MNQAKGYSEVLIGTRWEAIDTREKASESPMYRNLCVDASAGSRLYARNICLLFLRVVVSSSDV